MTIVQAWRAGANRLSGDLGASPGYVAAWESSLTWGQLQLGVNVYSGIRAWSGPDSPNVRLVHAAPNSTSVPTKHKGHGPAVVTGTLLVDGGDLGTVINDVRDGSAIRKLMWLVGTSPVYAWVYSGDITGLAPLSLAGTGPRKYQVSFRFVLAKSKVYWVSDDTVAWGA